MKTLHSFAVLMGGLFLTSCSPVPMVKSERATAGEFGQGVAYSLPKQLVKVEYVRQPINSTKAAELVKKKQEQHDETEKALKAKKKEEKEQETLIKSIGKDDPQRAELEAKLNMELTKIKAQKLVLTKLLATHKDELLIAKLELAQSLHSDGASTKSKEREILAKKAVEKTETDISNLQAKRAKIREQIANIPSDAPNRTDVEADLARQLNEVDSKLSALNEKLSVEKAELAEARIEYVESLKLENAYSEKIEITPLTPIPDIDNTFYANLEHKGRHSDTLELKTSNGLLDGAIGHSEDKSGEIVVSLVGSVAGLTGPFGFAQPAAVDFLVPSKTDIPILAEVDRCVKQPIISISQVIDPCDEEDIVSLNRRLKAGCIYLHVKPPPTTVTPSIPEADGLIYRQPGPFEFVIKNRTLNSMLDENLDDPIQTIRLNLAQGGQIGVIPMPRGNFAKNEYDVAFSHGMLVKSKSTRPSEVLGAVMILPNSLRAIFAIPTELIQLKINYSSKEKEMIELQKAILEAQLALDKQQLEFESSSQP